MAVLKYLDTSNGGREWVEFFVASPGVSWIPSINPNTMELTWTNNAQLPNPIPVTLKASGIEMYDTAAHFPMNGGDSLYLDKATNILYSYNRDSHTYTPLQNAGGGGGGLTVEIVSSLPTFEISPSTIYCVQYVDGTDEENRYDEFMWINNDWELLSSSSREGKVNSSNVANATDINNILNS